MSDTTLVSPSDRITTYLKSEAEIGGLSPAMAAYAEEVTAHLGALAYNASVGVGADDVVMFCWNKANHHLELELFPDRHGEWFYLDHDTNAMWEAAYDATAPLDPRVVWFGEAQP